MPELTAALKLTPEVLADIYPRQDQEVERIPRSLPTTRTRNCRPSEISVVYRTDGSGTTNVFTDYLSAVSAEWKEKVGRR